MPTLAPDTWLAPDAVIIGDVDLYDRVRRFLQILVKHFQSSSTQGDLVQPWALPNAYSYAHVGVGLLASQGHEVRHERPKAT